MPVRVGASYSLLRELRFGNSGGAQAFQQVITDSKRVGDDRERRIHSRTRREEAAVHNVQVVEIMGFAIGIER